MRQIEKTPFYSKKLGYLPKGCQMCVKGEKLVLYITGVCPRQCWYCPLSETRKNKDLVFVNEWQTNNIDDLLEEVRLGQSKGCGITGGDPLSRLDRTLEYIGILKKELGKDFHIHLYTSFDLVNEEKLRLLYDSGVDEIRFHADLDNDKFWSRIYIANKFKWDVGLEIPCIPSKINEIKKLCDYMDGKIKFLNLNEFEISDMNSEKMYEKGFKEKSVISHAIKGSSKVGNEILRYCLDKTFNVHFCSSKLKDKVQMQNRFKLRAKSVKTKFDVVTDEGLLIRGCIYLGNGDKSFKNRDNVLKELEERKRFLEDEGLEVYLDENKLRLITYPEHVEQFKEVLKSLGLIPAIIEEDPTVEAFEVNRDFL